MSIEQCAICEIEDEDILLAVCFRCGQWFHLNPYQRPGRDCGDAILGDEEMGVHYYCNPCLGEMQEESMAAYQAAYPPPAEAAAPPSEPSTPATSAPPRPRRRFRRIDS